MSEAIDQVTGYALTAERVARGLLLKTTPEGRAELRDAATRQDTLVDSIRHAWIEFKRPHVTVWCELLADMEACRDLHMLADHEYELLGAMTSAPIIVTMPAFNSDGELVSFDAAFWFPNYQVESELETLLRKGAVTFELASEPQDLHTCECGFQTYNAEKMHDHTETCEGAK